MSTERQTSRRLFLAAGSASAVFGALAKAAAGSMPADDPIFEAIDRHKAAEARYSAACALTDEVAAERQCRVVTAADVAEFDGADRACDEALSEFLMTAPTTIAGARTFLRHCIDEAYVEEFLTQALETLLRCSVLADREALS
ncbi:MAG: hypothetical protein U1E25_14450 [Methylocystis sp.]